MDTERPKSTASGSEDLTFVRQYRTYTPLAILRINLNSLPECSPLFFGVKQLVEFS